MRMWSRGKRRTGVSFVSLNHPGRPQAPRRGLEEPAPSLSRGRSSMRRSGAAFWSILRDAKLRLAPQDEVRDARFLVRIVAFVALIAFLPSVAAIADNSAPVISPDRIEDAPSIQ